MLMQYLLPMVSISHFKENKEKSWAQRFTQWQKRYLFCRHARAVTLREHVETKEAERITWRLANRRNYEDNMRKLGAMVQWKNRKEWEKIHKYSDSICVHVGAESADE